MNWKAYIAFSTKLTCGKDSQVGAGKVNRVFCSDALGSRFELRTISTNTTSLAPHDARHTDLEYSRGLRQGWREMSMKNWAETEYQKIFQVVDVFRD